MPAPFLSVDADVGRDKTCWTIIDEFGIIEQIVRDVKNTMEIAGLTIELIRRHDLPAQSVVFDAGGGGKQIADRLIEQGHYVMATNFGEIAEDKQAYPNSR